MAVRATIGKLLEKRVDEDPGRDALVYVDPPLRLNYGDFNTLCNRAAKGLLRLGIGNGDHVAVWANNVPEWVITQFATAKIGVVLVTVNTNYRAFELEYLLRHSDSRALFLVDGVRDSEYLQILEEIWPQAARPQTKSSRPSTLPELRHVVTLSPGSASRMMSWQQLLQLGDEVGDQELARAAAEVEAEDVVNIQYTSGTTGRPKGVMLTHNNLIGNAQSISECLQLTGTDRLCIPVPFFHCFGCVLGTLTCVVSGATMVPVVRFDPERVLETVEREKCTALHGVPTMFIAELEALESGHYDTSTLRTGIMAGSPCPVEVMRAVIDRMGARQICITYGQTESSPGITMTRPDDSVRRRVSTVGRALPNVEVKIVDPESAEEVPRGTQGELCTRGYLVMKGYYKRPEETAAVIDEQGWLHTGDLAVMDEAGYCRITGRLKDMIIRAGENIYPREIEEFLYTHPAVRDVQVVGVPSRKYGEEVAAFIQPKEDTTPEQIRKYCEGQIAWHKIPAHIFFVEEYPTTASGKIQKYKLRETATEALHRQEEADIETA